MQVGDRVLGVAKDEPFTDVLGRIVKVCPQIDDETFFLVRFDNDLDNLWEVLEVDIDLVT
jgi:hypothetical protein